MRLHEVRPQPDRLPVLSDRVGEAALQCGENVAEIVMRVRKVRVQTKSSRTRPQRRPSLSGIDAKAFPRFVCASGLSGFRRIASL